MKSMRVATPLLAAMVMGLPAVADASVRRADAPTRVSHVQTVGQPEAPATILRADPFRQVVAQQPSGSVRRPPDGGGGSSGGSSGGGSGGGGGTSGGSASGGGGESSSGAVSRGEARRPSGSSSGEAQGNNRAVPRGNVRQDRGGGRNYYYYRPNPWYWDRWGYGGFGLGYFYYSPWAWYGPGPGYGYGYGGWGRDDGGVRLKVKPKDAEVLVDGYYAGMVDDFDGSFQSLKLDPGSYRIEVRKEGFESLSFDVRVQRDRTITFHGDMKARP
jgi:hypothetical protein